MRVICGLLLASLLVAGCGMRTRRAPVVNERSEILREFQERVDRYMQLHKKVESKIPPVGDKTDAAKIKAYEDALATGVREARRDAEQGEIFFQGVRHLIRQAIAQVLSGLDGRNIRGSIMDENPVMTRLRVNAPWPQSAPLSTVPPSILSVLPKLPEDLEYRFVRNSLVLRDIDARMIVDYIPAAFR